MKNLSNLLAVFVLVAMMGLLVGCGCGTANTPAEEDMVDNTTEEVLPTRDAAEDVVPPATTVNPSANQPNTDTAPGTIVDDNGNLVDENGTVTDEHNNTTGNIVEDAGDMVGDVVEDAGNAVEDVGDGVRDMTNGNNR